MRHRLFSRITPIFIIAAIAVGCAVHARNINDIRNNPGRYYNRSVSLEGVVTNAWGIPLVPVKVYKIDDGSGELTVISRSGRTPTRGARVRVRGKVSEVAVFGGQSLGLHIQEEHLSILRQ